MTDVPNVHLEKYGHGEVEYKLCMYLYREMFELDSELNKSMLNRNANTISRLIRWDPSQEMEDKEMGIITVINYSSEFCR